MFREALIKPTNHECRADKRSASANYSGGCAAPKVEFGHTTRLNQRFLRVVAHRPGKFFARICLIFVTLFCASTPAQNTEASRPDAVNLEITTHLGDQQIFVAHDVISFFISLDKAAYLYAFYQDATGQLFQIMPGPALLDNYFEPGFYIPFPPQDSSFQFEVQAPFGEEQLWVFASDNGKLVFNKSGSNRGIQQLTQSPAQLSTTIMTASQQLFGHTKLLIHTRSR